MSGSTTQEKSGITNQSTSQNATQSGTQTQDVGPWGPQAGALTDAFGNAQTAYGKASQAVAPTDYVAQMTPAQLAAFNQMVAQGSNLGIPGTQADTAGTLQTAGSSGVSGALTGLSGYDPTKLNNASSIVDAANQYVAGQDIDAQVRDAMLNATQTARDVTLPGIERNAALTGNTNSSRTGIDQGLVERGLAEQSADLGATLRNAAFTHGLDLAQQQAQNNNTGTLGALQALGLVGNSATGIGVNAGTSSVANQGALSTEAAQGGAGLTAAQQANLDNLYKQYQAAVSTPYDPINGLMSIIGSQKWGSTGTETSNNTGSTTGTASGTSTENTKTTPSAWQIIGGLLGGAGSLASTGGSLGWKPFG